MRTPTFFPSVLFVNILAAIQLIVFINQLSAQNIFVVSNANDSGAGSLR